MKRPWPAIVVLHFGDRYSRTRLQVYSPPDQPPIMEAEIEMSCLVWIVWYEVCETIGISLWLFPFLFSSYSPPISACLRCRWLYFRVQAVQNRAASHHRSHRRREPQWWVQYHVPLTISEREAVSDGVNWSRRGFWSVIHLAEAFFQTHCSCSMELQVLSVLVHFGSCSLWPSYHYGRQ